MPPAKRKEVTAMILFFSALCCRLRGQKLSEAFIVNLSDGSILLTEKNMRLTAKSAFIFSELFLECHAPLSQKSKLDIVTRAVEQVNKSITATKRRNAEWK